MLFVLSLSRGGVADFALQLNANQPVDNYWIRAQPSAGNTTFLNGLNSAILRYVGASAVEPTTSQSTATAALVERNLKVRYSSIHPFSENSPTDFGLIAARCKPAGEPKPLFISLTFLTIY